MTGCCLKRHFEEHYDILLSTLIGSPIEFQWAFAAQGRRSSFLLKSKPQRAYHRRIAVQPARPGDPDVRVLFTPY
jgi:hypothetical protein